MAIFSIRVPTIITAIIAFGAAFIIGAPAGGSEHAGFSQDVLPILQQHCSECHQAGGAGQLKSGLDLSTYEGVMKGTNFGAIVVPGSSFTSNLSVLIEGRARPEINMPHNRAPLSKWQRHLIRSWIDKGAKNN